MDSHHTALDDGGLAVPDLRHLPWLVLAYRCWAGRMVGWDPVENASLLPWLTGTAFLHSVMMQEKRGMMKVWNMWLIFSTFLLAIFAPS